MKCLWKVVGQGTCGTLVLSLLVIQVWCESTHATSFAVRFVTTCPLCTSVPVNFWEFENKMPVSGWVVVALAVLVCLHCAWLHAEDRKDWIPPRQNQFAYFLPPRPVRRNKSALAVLRRILFNLASGLNQQHAHRGLSMWSWCTERAENGITV